MKIRPNVIRCDGVRADRPGKPCIVATYPLHEHEFVVMDQSGELDILTADFCDEHIKTANNAEYLYGRSNLAIVGDFAD